jgi:phosphoglucosamine mutase
MEKLFGTDGIRGEAGIFPLDKKTLAIVGSSLARHLEEELGRSPLIVIGRDTRESGEWIEEAVINGVLAQGGECTSAGVITTPGVAFLTKNLPADAGIVISASHNPYTDNGIKLFSPTGQKFDTSTEQKIERDIADNREPSNARENRRYTDDGHRQRYIDHLVKTADGMDLKGMRVVIDGANGAAFSIGPEVIERLGGEVIAINCSPDGRNINRDCGSLHLEKLQEAVCREKASLGVAFDGDADRSLFVDSHGNAVDGDGILWILAKYYGSKNLLNQNLVVGTLMTNIGLELALKNIGVNLIRTNVGDKYVLDELLRSGARIGGEQSGHIIFPYISLAGDGILTLLNLLKVTIETQVPIRRHSPVLHAILN